MIDAEKLYQHIFDDYLSNTDCTEVFIERFMKRWRADRDAPNLYNEKFQRLIDRIFTSCDCFSEVPSTNFEITEEQLKQEIGLLRHIWFG